MIGHIFPGLRCFGTHQSMLGHYIYYYFMFYHIEVSLAIFPFLILYILEGTIVALPTQLSVFT